MMKKSLVWLLVGLMVISIVVGAGLIRGEGERTLGENLGFWAEAPEQGTIMWIFFFLILMFVYTLLGTAKMPENKIARFIISGLVSYLGIFLITPAELWGLLASYKALGIGLSVFIPIFILVFITLAMTKKGNMFGALSTTILWIVYSVYTFFKGLLAILVNSKLLVGGKVALAGLFKGTAPSWVEKADTFFNWLLTGFDLSGLEQATPLMGIILIFVGIGAFWFGVLAAPKWEKWMKKRIRELDLEEYKDMLSRSHEKVKADAEQTRGE